MQWCLKVRVVRLRVIPDREKEDNPQSMEKVLQDKKGDRIHATVGRYVMRLFKGKIKKYSVRNTWHASKLWVNPDLPQVVDFKTRYKLQVRVMDGTGFISLLLWDREATKFIGKSATQLKGQTTDSDDDGAYPVELNTILDKNALFKVVVKRHNVEHVEFVGGDHVRCMIFIFSNHPGKLLDETVLDPVAELQTLLALLYKHCVAAFYRVNSALLSNEIALPISVEEGFTCLLATSKGYQPRKEEYRLIADDLECFSRDELLKVDSEGCCLITDHGYFVLFNIYGPRAVQDDPERIQFKLMFSGY
ncbi:DNA-(apurinic or apyrimidinic site) lyase 2 [Capsicum chinense]|nr:DNA-(apurinic or apyrimidinic site) lyase 2 [Capsicum chinense]